MQKRHSSVTKLPDIYAKKKDKILEMSRKFDKQFKKVEQNQQYNNDVMNTFDIIYGTSRRSFSSKKLFLEEAREIQRNFEQIQKMKNSAKSKPKESQVTNKKLKPKINNTLKQQQLSKLKKAQANAFAYKTPLQKLSLLSSQVLEHTLSAHSSPVKRKKSAAIIKTQRQKEVLPCYSAEQQKIIEVPFTKIHEDDKNDKIKVRLANGIIKQVNRTSIYYKVGDQEEVQNDKKEKEQNEEIESQMKNMSINVDYTFLNQIMSKVGKNIPIFRREELMQDLIQNYKISVYTFNNNYNKPGWLTNKFKYSKAMIVEKQVVKNLQHKLVCSDELNFLNIFGLKKITYIPMLIEAHTILKKLQQYIHFDVFQMFEILNQSDKAKDQKHQQRLNSQNEQKQEKEEKSPKSRTRHQRKSGHKKQQKSPQKSTINPAQHYNQNTKITNLNLDQHLRRKKSQIDLIIYELEKQIQKIKQTLTKDVEHVIKLNARLVGTPYKEYIRTFILKFSTYIGVITRSTLSKAIYNQLQILGKYYTEYTHIEHNSVLAINHPNTQFYNNIYKINAPYITPFTKTQIQHGPLLLMLEAKIKRMKKKSLRNVYKFLIESRKQIRAYPHKVLQTSKETKNRKQITNEPTDPININLNLNINQQRIQIEECYSILKSNIVQPIKKYIEAYLSQSQNVNGCISNINLNIHKYGEIEKFDDCIKSICKQIEENTLKQYIEYFSLWELYFLEKPYIQQMVMLFKRINGIRLMQDQMKNLKSDLQIIQSFPNVIEDKILRLDITVLKSKIISAINTNITKIVKASEDILQHLLTIGLAETQKAQKLNEITPYSTIAEYIAFAKALSNRGVEKSIQKIAMNAVVLYENWNFLQHHNYPVKNKIMKQYLQSCIWVHMLRKASNANKAKLIINPQIFITGVADKKYQIYYKYMFIVREIAELIKVSEIVQWDRYSILAKNIHNQLQQITKLARDIGQEEDLLRMQYYIDPNKQTQIEQSKKQALITQLIPDQAKQEKQVKNQKQLKLVNTNSKSKYKQNFTFFYRQEIYLQKFAKFWQYASKFKNEVVEASSLTLYEVNGQSILKVIRQGQQILNYLKLATVNKRLLGLVEKLSKEIEPYVKNSKMIKILCNGSEKARNRAIFEMKVQLAGYIENKRKEIQERKKKIETEKIVEQILKEDADNQNNKFNQAISKQLQSKLESKQLISFPSQSNPIQTQQQKQSYQKIQQQLTYLNSLGDFQKVQDTYLTLKQLVSTSLPALNLVTFYQVYPHERRKQQILAKIKKISAHIKTYEPKIKQIQICEPIQPVEIVQVPLSLIEYVEKQYKEMNDLYLNICQQSENFSQKLMGIFLQYSHDLEGCLKKLLIFLNSLISMKKVQPIIEIAYSWFELILPSLIPASSQLHSQFHPIYDSLMQQYSKKLHIITKLSFHNLYEDRIRVNYEEQIYKLEEFKIKAYNHTSFGMKALNQIHNNCCLGYEHHLFSYFSTLPTQILQHSSMQGDTKFQKALKSKNTQYYNYKKQQISHLLPQGCTNLTFSIKYNEKQKYYYVYGYKLWTIYNQVVVLLNTNNQSLTKTKDNEIDGFVKKLFNIELSKPKNQQNEEEIRSTQKEIAPQSNNFYTCKSGILEIIENVKKTIPETIKLQTLQILPIIYSYHYNMRQIFNLYIYLQSCLFQSIITSLYAVFYMDLMLVWENDYDIMVLREKISQCYNNGYDVKESENGILVQMIYNSYEVFIGIIDMIARRKLQQSDIEVEGTGTEAERFRKKIIIEFMPMLLLTEFQSEANKKLNRAWILELKKKKEDDFINQTHLNPAFCNIIVKLNESMTTDKCKQIIEKIQTKEVEKKQEIPINLLRKSIFNNIISQNVMNKILSYKSSKVGYQQKLNFNINKNSLMVFGYKNYSLDYGYQIIRPVKFWPDELQQTINATWVLLQAQRHNKIFITNTHPNCNILGSNIVFRFVKISRNQVPGHQIQQRLQQLQKKERSKNKKDVKYLNPRLMVKNNNNQNLNQSQMSNSMVQTPQKSSVIGKTPMSFMKLATFKNIHLQKNRRKNIIKINPYQTKYPFDEYNDNDGQREIELNAEGMLEKHVENMLNSTLTNKQDNNFICIVVQDQQSMNWLIQYLVKFINTEPVPRIYIHSQCINAQSLFSHQNIKQCLIYINGRYEQYSRAVINAYVNQNKAFTTHKNQQSNSKEIVNIIKNETARVRVSSRLSRNFSDLSVASQFNSNNGCGYIPLTPFLHKNPLLQIYYGIYPYSSFSASSIYINSIISPLLLSHTSSPNLVRNPYSIRYKQLVQKCISKYYIWLGVEDYLQMQQMEGIIHGFYYNAFVVQSAIVPLMQNFIHQNAQVHNNAKYIIESKINRIMRTLWNIILRQINKIEQGEISVLNELNNNSYVEIDINNIQNQVQIYALPVYGMKICDLLGKIQYKMNPNNTGAINKNTIESNSYKVSKHGILESIVQLGVMATNLASGIRAHSTVNPLNNSQQKSDSILEQLQQFLLTNKSHSNTHNAHHISRWFVLDLSVVNETTKYIYRWLNSAFTNHWWVFINGHTLYWDHDIGLRMGSNKKNVGSKNRSSSGGSSILNIHHVKLIIIAHPQLVRSCKVESLPRLDFLSNYNPVLQLTLEVPKLFNILKTSSTKLPPISTVIDIFNKIIMHGHNTNNQQQLLQSITKPLQKTQYSKYYSYFTPYTISILLTKLQIMFNELRKYRIANGLYWQNEIPESDKKDIFVSSIELREKVKGSYQNMVEMLEIEKRLDTERKEMFKIYVQIFNAVIHANNNTKVITKQQVPKQQQKSTRNIAFNPNYLSLEQLKQSIANNFLSLQLQQSLMKDLEALQPELIPEIGLDTFSKIIVQTIYSTLAALNPNQEWRKELSEWVLDVFKTEEKKQQTQQPIAKKKNMKIGKNKSKKNIINIVTNNSSNLLNIPSIFSSPSCPYPSPFSLVNYFYNISTNTWHKFSQLSYMLTLPNSINCTSNTDKKCLHPAQLLRLNNNISKQSALRAYCQGLGIQNDNNIILSQVDAETLWIRYLMVYQKVSTVLIYGEGGNNEKYWRFYEQMNKLSLYNNQRISLHDKIIVTLPIYSTDSINSYIKKWLEYNFTSLLNYNLYNINQVNSNRMYCSKFGHCYFDYSNSNYYLNNINVYGKNIFPLENQKKWRNNEDNVNVLLHLNLQLPHISNNQMEDLLSNYTVGIPVHFWKNEQFSQQKLRKRLAQVIEKYMKYNNLNTLVDLFITIQDAHNRANKNKANKKSTLFNNEAEGSSHKKQHKSHHQYILTEQQIQKQKQILSEIIQVHLNKVITLFCVYEDQKLYKYALKILQLEEQSENWSKYNDDLFIYGINIVHSIEHLYAINGELFKGKQNEKNMKSQLLINGTNDNTITPETIEQERKNTLLKVGKMIFDYIFLFHTQNSATSSQSPCKFQLTDSKYFNYVPKYLLPKPKKYKSHGSTYFNEFICLDKLNQQTNTASQSNIKASNDKKNIETNSVQIINIEVVKIVQNSNQSYLSHHYKLEHNYALLYELNTNVILSLITSTENEKSYTKYGIGVDKYMDGFLLCCQSKVFVQSQLYTANDSPLETNSSPEHTISTSKSNPILIDTINLSIQSYNKQFSLLDQKVVKIMSQFWKNMHKPKIRVNYKSIYAVEKNKQEDHQIKDQNGDCIDINSCRYEIKKQYKYVDELLWITEIDINGNKEYLYKQRIDDEEHHRIKSQSEIINKQSFHFQLKNNMFSRQIHKKQKHTHPLLLHDYSDDNLIGILNIVEVKNKNILVDSIVQQFKKSIQRGRNQYYIILLHSEGENQTVDNNNKMVLQKQLRSNLWIHHKQSSNYFLPQPKENQQQLQSSKPKLSPFPIHQADVPFYLSPLYGRKFIKILEKLTHLHYQVLNEHYIPEGIIGKVYKPAITKKIQQMQQIIIDKKEEQATRKQIYDNCILQMQQLSNKIQELTQNINQNTKNKELCEILLKQVTEKLNNYTGQAEFNAIKQEMMKIPVKNFEKQLLKISYIEDNPLNLSFIYRFNVLADNAYFPDKNFEVTEQLYEINGKYSVFEEQKKQFIKLFNMGRFNVMLENEDYWPTQDQIEGAQKIRSKFIYLGALDLAKQQDTLEKSQNQLCFSLANNFIKQQLAFIEAKSSTPLQTLFHRYIAYLSSHAYIRHYLHSRKNKYEKQIKTYEDENKTMSNKITDFKFKLKSLEEKEVAHKSRLDRAIQEVGACQYNQTVFREISEKNIEQLIHLYEQNVFGCNKEELKACLQELSSFIVFKISRDCLQCRSLNNLIQNNQTHPLSLATRRYLFYLLRVSVIKSSILSYKVKSISKMYSQMYLYLIKQLLDLGNELILHKCLNIKDRKYRAGIDERKYNIVQHYQLQFAEKTVEIQDLQLTEVIISSIFPQYLNEHLNLIRKLERKQELLGQSLNKFVEKINIIQSKQLQSIQKFEINQQMIENIMEGYKRQCSIYDGIDYLGEWKRKNEKGYSLCKEIVKIIKNKESIEQIKKQLKIKNELNIENKISIKFLAKLVGQTIFRGNYTNQLLSNQSFIQPFVYSIFKQLLYFHIPNCHKTALPFNKFEYKQENIQEVPIYKLSIQKMSENSQNTLKNRICTFDSILGLANLIYFIQGDRYTEKILQEKSIRYSTQIIWKMHPTQSIATETNIQQQNMNKEPISNEKQDSLHNEEENSSQKQKIRQNTENSNQKLNINREIQYYIHFQDPDKQKWVIYYLHLDNHNNASTFSAIQSIRKSIAKLQDRINEHKQQNTKYLFILRNDQIIKYIEGNIQPIYRGHYEYSLLSTLRGQLCEEIVKQYKKRRSGNKLQEFNSSKEIQIELVSKIFQYYSNMRFQNISSHQFGYPKNMLELFTKNINQRPSQSYKVQSQSAYEEQQNLQLNCEHILYPNLNFLPSLFKYIIADRPSLASSSKQYRMIKKLVQLCDSNKVKKNRKNKQNQHINHEVVEGYEIFKQYYINNVIGQQDIKNKNRSNTKYDRNSINKAINLAHKQLQIQLQSKYEKQHNQQLNNQGQSQQNQQVIKIKTCYIAFIKFINFIHQLFCTNIPTQQPKQQSTNEDKNTENFNQLINTILINQNLLIQSHTSINKHKYSKKVKDIGEEIIKNLFAKSNSKSKKSIQSATKFLQLIYDFDRYLADPKIYVILNKTFKNAINKIYNVKTAKKMLQNSSKEGRKYKKLFHSFDDAIKLFNKQQFMNIWNQVSEYYKLQFAMWLYSEIQDTKINNLYLVLKPKVKEVEQRIQCNQNQNEQNIDEKQQNRVVKTPLKMKLHCIKYSKQTEKFFDRLATKKPQSKYSEYLQPNAKIEQVIDIQIEIQANVAELDNKVCKFYRGLLFKYEDLQNQGQNIQQNVFNNVSTDKQTQFLHPNFGQMSRQPTKDLISPQYSLPSSYKQAQSPQSPLSPASPFSKGSKQNKNRDSIVDQVLKQSVSLNVNKISTFIIPIYWNFAQIGVLQMNLKYSKGFDPIKTYATIN